MQRIMRRLLPKAAVLSYGIGLLLLAALLLFLWPGLSANLLATGSNSEPFMPHEHCYLFIPQLVYLHLSSDLLIGISYVAISLTLAYLVYKARRDIPFHWVLLAFGLFIIACGGTHFMEVYNTFTATYWLAGYVKLVTAVASIATAIVLPPLVPRALALVQTAKLSEERRLRLEANNHELERLYEKVKEVDELKSQFFANVSHELRTPLALILGPTEKLLSSQSLTTEQQQSLEVINRNAHSLLKQVGDLLDIAKLEAGKMGVHYAKIDLARLLRLVASHFDSLALERQIQLAVETPPTASAEADPEKLQRVLLNLLVNAFKFTPESGEVRCELRVEDKQVVIEIQDSGPGVPVDLREAIFDRFRQGEGGSTRRFGGTGLGLSIAREFVQLHSGQLNVESSPIGGALFRLTLPRSAPADAEIQTETATAAEDAREVARQTLEELRAITEALTPEPRDAEKGQDVELQGGEGIETYESGISRLDESTSLAAASPHAHVNALQPLVLVVEDNPEMSRFIIETLSSDYRVVAALNGQEGLEQALALKPDLIISDVMMPQMSGDQMLHELRSRHEMDDVPVLMLTAKADDEMRVQLLHDGAQDYLMKPFAVLELRARAGNLIKMKRVRNLLQQELASQSKDLEELAHQLAARQAEQQQTLSALRESEERYRYLADAMPQIVWTARPDGYFDYYNQRWFEYTGMTMEQSAGWGWQPVLHPADAEMCLRRWATSVVTGENYQVEYRFKRAADGQYRWHLGRAVPMLDEEGRIIKWFGTSTDIDGQKRAEEAAQESNRAKDNFLATLSHELRAPLTPIIGWVHMIRAGMVPLTESQYGLSIIDKHSQSLMHLINDLLDMSAIMSGKMHVERLPVSLPSVLREAIETAQLEADKRRIEINLTSCDEEDMMVSGDRTRLIQVFWNLLNNAVKFSPENSVVRVKCEADGSEQRIIVEDEGQGIAPDFLPHVFEQFRQADESKTRAHGGLGIGLALVKNLVVAHGGRVIAESAGVNQGSRFTIHLPRLAEPASSEAPHVETTIDKTSSLVEPAHLLLVEDSEDILTLLQTALGVRGYRTTPCESATEALRIGAATKFDLIISDIGLPQMDGYELLKRLREFEHLRDVPAIALTGYASLQDEAAALNAGYDRHLAKPIDPSELVAAIEHLLQQNGAED